jgi:hypothetical protein
MPRIHVINVPEFAGIVSYARLQQGVSVAEPHKGYITISSDQDLIFDRRGCGFKPALWYTCLSGGLDGTITEFGRDILRISGRSPA